MKQSTLFAFRKWLTVLGSFLIIFPLGITWYWGNVSVYALSYVRKHHPSNSDVDAPWVMSLIVVGFCIGIVSSAVMTRTLGKRLTSIIAITIVGAGWLGGYFAIQKSVIAMNILIGLVIPIGTDIALGSALLYAVEWCDDDDAGIVLAIVQSGFTAGAMCINQIVTLYLNPDNLSPVVQIGPSRFFTQDEVVDKVPSVFLIIMSMALICSFLGLLMTRERSVKDGHSETRSLSEATQQVPMSLNSNTNNGHLAVVGGSNQGKTDTRPSQASETDLSPNQIFRTTKLYIYWFLFTMAEFSYIIVCNYYKEFGQLFVKDDHFLTNVSTALLVVITFARTFWGFILDRCGVKASFIIYFSSCGIISLCFYFSPFINRWCYVIFTLVFGCFGSPLYILFSYAAVENFGKYYLLYNFGIIMLPTLLTNLTIPSLFQYFLVNWGWFYVFGFCSCCNLLGLVVVILYLPRGGVSK